ncbi:MAG: gfo/Idh/MocA family oxidoreductase, partial [Planctomycetes bacterium]|nr:gfo/Idh/MocA family oxidoreductase [Planctomycetota bacterium]
YYPLCLEVRDRLSCQPPNRIWHVQGSYTQDWLLHDTDFNWRVLAAEGGELRALADIGTHWLDLVQFITQSRVTALCADLIQVHPTRRRPVHSTQTFAGTGPAATNEVPIDTEDAGNVLLRFDSGAQGSLNVSQVMAGRKNCLRFEIAAADEAFAWDSEHPNELWIGRREQPNGSLLRDPSLLGPTARAATSYPGGHNEGYPDTFKQLFRSVYDYVNAGDLTAERLFPTFADGHREILLCEAMLTSHRERRWVDIPQTP